jgi:hypothetical protein
MKESGYSLCQAGTTGPGNGNKEYQSSYPAVFRKTLSESGKDTAARMQRLFAASQGIAYVT